MMIDDPTGLPSLLCIKLQQGLASISREEFEDLKQSSLLKFIFFHTYTSVFPHPAFFFFTCTSKVPPSLTASPNVQRREQTLYSPSGD